MSAIYGIINKDGRPVDPEQVQKMKQAMAHRAKDGSSELICDNAAFGFCHLIVYHNQEYEQLPITDDDLVLTANAHLHNRDELTRILGSDKLQYSKTPDAYLILEAYKKWGEDCVHHLDGEYVYAIWNKVSKSLFISKDRIGHKCLYYLDDKDVFIFSSEIKAIEAVKSSNDFFDPEILINYFFHEGKQDCTYNKQIKSLTGATNLQISGNKVQLHKYWQLKTNGFYRFNNTQDWAECLRNLFITAVKQRLNTERSIGVKLSGGLDSSSIACVLATILAEKNLPLYSYSSVLPGSARDVKDESHFRKMVLDAHPNIIATEISAENLNPFENVEEAFLLDENIPWLFHYMHLAITKAAVGNVQIMYTGLGGDHSVSNQGTTLIPQLINSGKFITAYKLIKDLAHSKKKPVGKVLFHEGLSKIRMVKYFLSNKRQNKPVFNQEFLKNQSYRSTSHQGYAVKVNSGWTGKVFQVLETRHEHFGITSANPYIDWQLLEFMEDVPKELYFKNGYKRYIFREAMQGILPESIRWRHSKSPYVINGLSLAIDHSGYALDNYIFNQKGKDEYFDIDILEDLGRDYREGLIYNDKIKSQVIAFSHAVLALATMNVLTNNKYFFK